MGKTKVKELCGGIISINVTQVGFFCFVLFRFVNHNHCYRNSCQDICTKTITHQNVSCMTGRVR